MPRFPLPVLIVLLTAVAPVRAQDADAHADETLVVARTVMPRIAYRALEPTANPIRVQATTFPGRVFHAAIDGLVGQLVAEHELDERASPATPDAESAIPGLARPMAEGPALRHGPGATAPLGAGASIGGAVLRATGGIGDLVQRSVGRATQAGGGG